MSNENRRLPRFPDFARAKINELSALSGFLEDVSQTGCKVRFPHSFEVDTDREYSLHIQPSHRSGIPEFILIVRPQWVQRHEDSTEIGFFVLHSPGIRQFNRYVDLLSNMDEPAFQEA